MENINVGPFEIEITGPHPCWVTIKYADMELYHIRHTELRDLQYAVGRAIQTCRNLLGTHGHEMD